MSADYFGHLRKMHLFDGVDDETLRRFVGAFEVMPVEAGRVMFREGDRSSHIYIIYTGRVTITAKRRQGEASIATLEPGDYFGEIGVFYDRRRNASARAAEACVLLRVEAERFRKWLERYPGIRANLEVAVRTRGISRKQPFKWLPDDEVIYLATHKHRILLFLRLALSGMPLLGALGAAMASWVYGYGWVEFLAGLLLAVGLLWSVWQYFDWANDYYIATNKRVVWLEKVVGLYDSRTEAPLWSIRAVQVSMSYFGSLLRYGDVTIQTISGTIVFRTVPHPHAMVSLINEQRDRSRSRQRTGDEAAIKAAIRGRIWRQDGPPAPSAPTSPVTVAATSPGWIRRLLDYLPIQSRFEVGETVVYRKHIFVLARAIWRQVALLAFLVALGGLALLAGLPLASTCLAGAVPGLAVLGWAWYHYEDWRNDIYQVTRDQIVDRTKRPFGAETRRVAPLDNILSAQLDRRGIWSLMFNYGDVVIQTGGAAGEMRFMDVFDPSGVQQDIYRRLEAFQSRRSQADAEARRTELAAWLAAYHQVIQEPPPASASHKDQVNRDGT